MVGFPLQSIFPPHMLVRAIAMRAMTSIWEEYEKKGWKEAEDREFCSSLLNKKWIDYTDKEVKMVEMLALKYSDQPSPHDLAQDRVLN